MPLFFNTVHATVHSTLHGILLKLVYS